MPNQTILEAIQGRHVLQINYDGGSRLIEPHCYGRGWQGQEFLRAYQTKGYSRSGKSFSWKLFRVDRIGAVEDTGVVFDGPRPGYNSRGDSAMGKIFGKL